MSNPSELNSNPRVGEIRSLTRTPKKRRMRYWWIALLLLSAACALGWRLLRPALTALGIREINGYDYLCFRVRNETTDDANVQVWLVQGKMQRPVSHTSISQTDRGIWEWAEIGVPTHDALMFSRGQPIHIRVQITPHSRGFELRMRQWLSAIIPARVLYSRTVLASEAFVP